jgi:hypothetical protein
MAPLSFLGRLPCLVADFYARVTDCAELGDLNEACRTEDGDEECLPPLSAVLKRCGKPGEYECGREYEIGHGEGT